MSKSKHQRIVAGMVIVFGLAVLVRTTHVISRVRLGSAAVSILEGATRVEPLRVISPVEGADLEPGHTVVALSTASPMVDGCYVLAKGKVQGPAFRNRIADVLLDEGTYSFLQTGCEMEPGVVFRLWKGAESMDVVLCFHCGQMYTVTHDAAGNPKENISTLMAGDSRSKFAALAKVVFPNDPEIRAL